MTLLNWFSNIAPPAPEWVHSLFENTSALQLTLYFNIALWVIIFITAFMLNGYQRRYGHTLFQLFVTLWVLYQPFAHGILTLNLPANPIVANGFINFITTDGNILLLIQLLMGLLLLLTTIRYILFGFIINPFRYKMRQHEGSAYRKQHAKAKQRQHKPIQKQPVKSHKQSIDTPPKPSETTENVDSQTAKPTTDINAYL